MLGPRVATASMAPACTSKRCLPPTLAPPDTAANHRAQTRIRVSVQLNFNLRSEGLEVRVGHFRKIRSTLEVHACGGRRARIDCRSWEGADHFGSVSDSLPAKIECGRAAAL